jgi:hypothetical protein
MTSRDAGVYTVKHVTEALDKTGNNRILLNNPSDDLLKVLHVQENFLQAIDRAPANILVQDLSRYNTANEQKEEQ